MEATLRAQVESLEAEVIRQEANRVLRHKQEITLLGNQHNQAQMELKIELVKKPAADMDLLFSQFKEQLAEYKATYASQLEAAIENHEANLELQLGAKDIEMAMLRAEITTLRAELGYNQQQQNPRQVSARSAAPSR